MVPSRLTAATQRESRAQASNAALPPSECPTCATRLKSSAPIAGGLLPSAETTNDASSAQTPTTRAAVAYHASMLVSATLPACVLYTRRPSGKATTLVDPVGLMPTTAYP